MPKQDQTKIISAKDLGQLALDEFCPRCFWLERYFGKAPSIFPGIFNTLDSLSKKSTKRSFFQRDQLPEWLPLKNIKKQVKIPSLSVPVLEHGNWTLTGRPDDVFELSDGSFHVIDYKTAKFTEKQDSLSPMYGVQLNAYAFALPFYNIKPISKLSLIYCEPSEDLDTDQDFKLTFKTNVRDIEVNIDIIPVLLKRAREILNSKNPPKGRFGCNGICSWLENCKIK